LSRLPRCAFDRAYIERLVANDPETERHFAQYFGELMSLKLRSRLRSAALVEEAKQETFARVLMRLKQRKDSVTPEALGAFVNAVCNNVLFEMYRAGARTAQLDEAFDTADSAQAGGETTLLADEERERVRSALQSLPEKDRQILTWLFFEERDKDRICEELNIDRAYLRVLLHRAKERFKDVFVGKAASLWIIAAL
jgi:RNA polymerase sigma-70 factor, ECF subfamily